MPPGRRHRPGLLPEHRISDAMFYKWRTKDTRLEVSGVKELRQMEEDNRRLKHMGGAEQEMKSITARSW